MHMCTYECMHMHMDGWCECMHCVCVYSRMPNLPGSLHVLSFFMYTTTLLCMCYHYFHYVDEKFEALKI